ncbi:MAG: Exopolysaccharide biosynthesis polyprenyl glycosylphosphotransferase [uncultured bacterium]|nr:MAG: Exopolysaccharide biosynthesis polyprenyl glycosylphosphotransferase [uncultured bacterium]
MTTQRHWFVVTVRFVTDMALFIGAYMIAMFLRFSNEWGTFLYQYSVSIIAGGLTLSCGLYMSGMYNLERRKSRLFKRILLFFLIVCVAVIFMLGISYITRITVIGRGVMFIGAILAFIFVVMHYFILLKYQETNRERVAMIVGSEIDEIDVANLVNFAKFRLNLVGVIKYRNYTLKRDFKVLGDVEDMVKISEKKKLSRIICTNRNISDSTLYSKFCQLRYMGVIVMPEIGVYEEFYQMCPLTQVTPEWILNASTSPHMFYIRNIKRIFDVIISITGLIFLGPLMLIGMIGTKLTSKGDVFYKQIRLGQFGAPIKIIKLRSMRIDAEVNGVQWSCKDDPRVTKWGNILRKYRIDEIPQLINILKGDMSFVGPRPERPEFMVELEKEIPLFKERLLIQPGLTGWAQVNYPYCNTIDDSKRKLEYDLYYVKHMSLFLDLFIILDTLRIILSGGSKSSFKLKLEEYKV